MNSQGITEEEQKSSNSCSTKLSLLSSHLAPHFTAKLKPIDDCWAAVDGDAFLGEKAIALRKKTREFMTSIEPKLIHYTNTTDFPFEFLDGFKSLGINGFMLKGYGSPGLTNVETGAIVYEMAKVDGSLYTFLGLHNFLGIATIDKVGSEEQKQRILPDAMALKKIISFGLTEPDYGSDASSVKTTAKKVDGGYILNGQKRWIGSATFAELIIIWAKNESEGGKVQGFIVEKGSKGLTTKKIENKYALRIVQNADIYLDNVFVPDNNRLAKATDFGNGANLILESSRIKVVWGAVGIAAGAYEAALAYTLKRKQFGKPLAAFQLS